MCFISLLNISPPSYEDLEGENARFKLLLESQSWKIRRQEVDLEEFQRAHTENKNILEETYHRESCIAQVAEALKHQLTNLSKQMQVLNWGYQVLYDAHQALMDTCVAKVD